MCQRKGNDNEWIQKEGVKEAFGRVQDPHVLKPVAGVGGYSGGGLPSDV